MAKEILNREQRNPPFPTRFVVLLKALVESDVGPKPARQKHVIDMFFDLFKGTENQDLNRVLLRDEMHNYNHGAAVGLFEQFCNQVLSDPKNLAKHLYPANEEETEFNYHLQMIDLLGL
jgi:hypothetical protein